MSVATVGRPFPALAAMLAIGAAGTPSAAAQQDRAPCVREFVGERKRRLPGAKRSATGKRDPLRSQPWRFFKDGSAVDGRGDWRSPRRLARQRLYAKYGVTSGRQWVRLRRRLRQELA